MVTLLFTGLCPGGWCNRRVEMPVEEMGVCDSNFTTFDKPSILYTPFLFSSTTSVSCPSPTGNCS